MKFKILLGLWLILDGFLSMILVFEDICKEIYKILDKYRESEK